MVGPSHVDAPEGTSSDAPLVVQLADGVANPSEASVTAPVDPYRVHAA